MKFAPLLFATLLLAMPAALVAQSGTAPKGVVEAWAEARGAGTRAPLEAFIQRWPGEPLYIALARRILEELPPDPPIAERAPAILRTPLPPAPPQPFARKDIALPPADLAARRAPLPALFPLRAAILQPRIDLSPPLTTPQADAALEFLKFTIDLQLRPETDLAEAINTYYTARINFYGNDWTRAQVISDKRGFFARWPERRYAFIPDKTTIDCADNQCRIEAEMTFFAHSPARQATSSGRALFSYIVDMRETPLIQAESSTVLARD